MKANSLSGKEDYMKSNKYYEKGKEKAFKECYAMLADIFKNKHDWVTHSVDGEPVEYIPADHVRLCTVLILSRIKDEEFKVTPNAKKEEV